MGILNYILTHKLVIFLILAVAALAISLIVVLDKNNSSEDTTSTSTMTSESPITSSTTPVPDVNKFRLPIGVKPIAYDLFLYPNLDTGLFRGEVTIKAKVDKDTNELVLNSHLLNISAAKVDGNIVNYVLDAPYERLVLSKEDRMNFNRGTSTIEIEFDGSMKNKIVGLYRSVYKGHDGNNVQIATTKFEPTYARQAYPCFDEPNMKAKFRVHIKRPKTGKYIALSNYPQIGEKEFEDGILVDFEETVPMSTYLTCFIVSDFSFTETTFDNDGNDTKLRLYSSPGQANKLEYAKTIGQCAMNHYVKYFGIPFPLPKLDMVAIPDFVSGAMENWGIVTYRESALLFSNDTHSVINKQRVATVVAHELAHSWFGNLVTMDWWNSLWLNEGFATFMQFKGANVCEPEWKMMEQFIVDQLHVVLEIDAAVSSHPIIQTVRTPDQITEVFDKISYNKGASVLRMLENAVGESAFRQGVTSYLQKHKYGNAVSQDLWDELQLALGGAFNLTQFVDTFTIQMGYPVLTAEFDESGHKVSFTQKRFLLLNKNSNSDWSPFGYRWTVPVRYITDQQDGESAIAWFSHKDSKVSIDLPPSTTWIKFNPGQVGYYRVNYPEEHWQRLIDNMHSLPVADRAHLLEESFSIANAGELIYTIPLNMSSYLYEEMEYLPWRVANSKLKHILNHLAASERQSDFEAYLRTLVEEAYQNYTWDIQENETHLTRLARIEVLTFACSAGHPLCLEEAKAKFEDWLLKSSELHPDIRSLAYTYGMKSATTEQWDTVMEMYKNETDAAEKQKLMSGLANVGDPALLHKLLEIAKNESIVRKQDYLNCLQDVSGNKIGTGIVWDYVREHWTEMVAKLTLNDRYLGNLIPAITSTFATTTKLEEMKAFFAKYPEAGAGAAARKQALENVENNISWQKNYMKVVEDWISSLE